MKKSCSCDIPGLYSRGNRSIWNRNKTPLKNHKKHQELASTLHQGSDRHRLDPEEMMEKVISSENREIELLLLVQHWGTILKSAPKEDKYSYQSLESTSDPYLKNLSALPDLKGHSGGDTGTYPFRRESQLWWLISVTPAFKSWRQELKTLPGFQRT